MKEETPSPVTNNELVDMDALLPMDSETQYDNLRETQPNISEPPARRLMNNEEVFVDMDALPMDSEMQLDILQETQPNIMETPVPNHPKRRRKKSIVWEHFTIETVDLGSRRACCIQCKQSFAYSRGSKVSGTSHLKRHIPKCPCQRNILGKIQSTPSSTGIRSRKRQNHRTASVPNISFDADRCREEIARMIIMHDYPLHIVEDSGFIAFVRNLQPRFDMNMMSFNTVQGDCVATYLREKQNIQRVIEEGMHGRICLTLDLWSSSRTIGYIFVTGQFIDSEWKMHRKFLNVIMEPYPDSDIAFSHSVAACLSDWSMDGKLFSVAINQPLNDAALDNIRALLSVKNPLILNGQLLLGNCLARSLSSIVQSALTCVNGIVKKVRDSVIYVKTSESREEKFLELKQQLQVPSSNKNLSMDGLTQWNTTYEMLLTASELKEVFSCLGISDPDYKNTPSEEDWKQVETLCSFLKPLFDMANLLTTSTIPTTNTFFHETWKIQLELVHAAASEDPFVSTLTKSMHVEFDKYWKSCCFILAVAVVMDPRFKMKLVEFSFSKIYGEEAASYVKIVNEGIHELFREYVDFPLPLTLPGYTQGTKLENHEGTEVNGIGLMDFDAYIMETTSQLSKSELDQYLEESLLPRVHEFDVVGWWKLNRIKYPTLSKMARDILSIPVCTVPAGSVFDTVRKEMDSYRCSLRPETVEALICSKDWLKSVKMEISDLVVKMEVPI